MQREIALRHRGMTMRGMEHVPEAAGEKLPAVILLHGFTGTKLEPHRMFRKLSLAFERMGCFAFRFDFLGSGESDGEFEDMTVSRELAEASAILDLVVQDPRIDSRRVSLLGYSMGGLVASLLAGDRPHDIHKLVLVAAAGTMYEIVHELADYLEANPHEDVVDYGGNLVGRAFFEDLKELDAFARARPFAGDVLLVHGTKDEVVPYRVSSFYQQRVYGSRAILHPIEWADHAYKKAEWEAELIQAVCTFLQDGLRKGDDRTE